MNDSSSEVSEEDYRVSFVGRSAKKALKSTIRRVTAWRIRSHQRKTLMRLSDHLLKDIGLNRYEATKEYDKPFWRP
ncbi:hypothetical protein EOPP23_20035 [Endozoicomonas sp. OPT23]|uniref:DUF1127 domain-containing protein n=1 Tax=Endozoicomonas sp. OPT23 TaxID=2072845 RepID=UPI00129AF2A5|nr:DUF1127 domain-containing protein [Endozoicomonas sp. OPT23]MRI35263.1 hypothetical protein [Endozoicomonas sp. OPT23]